MNYFLKFKYAIWVIIILTVIILSSVATGLYYNHRPHRGKNPMERREAVDQMFKMELNLSDDQQIKFKKMHQSFYDSSRVLFGKLEEDRVLMVKELARPQPDTVALYRIADNMGILHARLKRETVNHLLLLRTVCNPSQIEKLNNLNNRLIGPEGPMRHAHNEKRGVRD